MREYGDKWKEWTGLAFIEGHWLRRKYFTKPFLEAVAQRIAQGEEKHAGELVLAVEAVSSAHEHDGRMRALEVFGRLRVWVTPDNTGVLLYIALDRHHIEIIADRGIPAAAEQWERVCAGLRDRLRKGDYTGGVHEAIEAIEAILLEHCPYACGDDRGANALSDRPVLL